MIIYCNRIFCVWGFYKPVNSEDSPTNLMALLTFRLKISSNYWYAYKVLSKISIIVNENLKKSFWCCKKALKHSFIDVTVCYETSQQTLCHIIYM